MKQCECGNGSAKPPAEISRSMVIVDQNGYPACWLENRDNALKILANGSLPFGWKILELVTYDLTSINQVGNAS